MTEKAEAEKYAIDSFTNPKQLNINGLEFFIKVVILYVLFVASVYVPPLLGIFRRGLFCDDESIRYNYHPNTITAQVLMIYGIGLNFFIILVVEVYRFYKIEKGIEATKYTWNQTNIHVLLVRIIKYFGFSQIGFVANVALNVSTKHFVGRLRPNFWEVCKLANGTCSIEDPYRYIPVLECTGKPEAVDDARKSFYSGHSAVALYCAVWSSLYIQARISKFLNNRMIIPFIQTMVLLSGLAICYTRISDNKHHWSDVLVGCLVGAFVAIYSCVYWYELFKENESDKVIEKKNGTQKINEVDSRVTLTTELSRDSSVLDPSSVRTTST